MPGRYAVICLSISLLIPLSPHAADTLMSEDIYLEDIPTVLTVSRLAQPASDAPSAVTVIDRETLRAAGIVDLADAFRLVPGMYVGHNAGYFHSVNPSVSHHGLNDAYSRRMQVLIDGRTVYQPMYGGVQWSDLPLTIEDIARIEVTRGPNAASHGANAFLGVINVITLHASESLGNSTTLTAGSTRKEIIQRHGAQHGDLHYRISLGYRNDEGIRDRDDTKHIRLLNLRADYRLSDRDELEFQFGFNGGPRQEGLLEEDPLVFLPRSKEVTSHFESLRWRRNLQPGSDFELHAYHSYDKSDDRVTSADLQPLFDPIPLASPRISFGNDIVTERYDIEAQHTFSPTRDTRVVWGGGARQDRADAPLLFGTDETQRFHLYRLFGHGEWRAREWLLLNVGAMLEHNNLTGSDISPRASANFSLTPHHSLRFGISRATRTPTYLEEKFNWRNLVPTQVPGLTFFEQQFLNPGGLEPETILSREIGYLGTFGRLSIDARLFHDEIRDLITQYKIEPFPVPAGLTPIDSDTIGHRNSGDITAKGFEMQLQLRFGTHSRIIANYARVRLEPDMNSTLFTSAGEERRFRELGNAMPDDTISILAWHRFAQHWTASLAYYQSSSTEMPGDGNTVASARHWDGRLARNFSLGRTQAEIALVAQNLFDQEYDEFARYNTMSRRAFVQLRLEY